jgi:alpha-beta hydrolase superfamily lysophospholipase
MKSISKTLKKGLILILVIFIIMNVIAGFHAYKFTHFDSTITVKTKDAKQLSTVEKIKTVLLGVNNPRPENKQIPHHHYESIRLKSNKEIECWLIKTENAKGSVILFHGYSGKKSAMLDKAEIFLNLGYNTLVVDFMGSGASEGNQTTIGYYEAEEVKTAYEYIYQGEKNIILFGTSMGAVAIMRAISDLKISPASIIIECPFGTMLKTVKARFSNMGIPSFPMAHLLVFWGGLQNNFNAFTHNPEDYAKNINCPTLLLYGQRDEKVSTEEINQIFLNLKGPKQIKIYPKAGHENYLNQYKDEWTADVSAFLSQVQPNVIDQRSVPLR